MEEQQSAQRELTLKVAVGLGVKNIASHLALQQLEYWALTRFSHSVYSCEIHTIAYTFTTCLHYIYTIAKPLALFSWLSQTLSTVTGFSSPVATVLPPNPRLA